MAMSKKDFIALADKIKTHNEIAKLIFGHNAGRMSFSEEEIEVLAQFCYDGNPRFDHRRWYDYIAGKCTANGRYFTEKELAAQKEE
jgi:hypothetical protein